MNHSRFVIESMSFCQGNCQGCFFSEAERVDGDFLKEEYLISVINFILDRGKKLKDLSINFGQGDHLALNNKDWNTLIFHIKRLSQLNPLITITTSAIEKFDNIKDKIDLIYDIAVKNEMRIFFAVVLDPKKLEHKAFQDRYIKNIDYIRNKFGFIDLTINVGSDTLIYMSPEKLNDFLIVNNFRHIELNLIPTVNTVQRFDNYQNIIEWFTKFRVISESKPYMVFHHYHFNEKEKKVNELSIPELKIEVANNLENNFYIENDLKVSSLMAGFTGNALPLSHKTGFVINESISSFNEAKFKQEQNRISNKMFREILLDNNCSSCEYKNICLTSGVMIFKNQEYKRLHKPKEEGCFIGIKKLWQACSKIKDKDITGVDKDLIPKGLEQHGSFGLDKTLDIKIS